MMGLKGKYNEITQNEAEDETGIKVWGTADKAYQQNLIVKACLNTPAGVYWKTLWGCHDIQRNT